MVQLASHYAEIQTGGAALWAVAPQDVPTNLALRQRRELPFPVLADADLDVIRAWGLFNDLDPKGRAIPYPATYVVGPGRAVAWAHVGVGTRERPTPGEVRAALRDSGAMYG